MPNIGEANERPYQSAGLIAENPDYGKIVCHCERDAGNIIRIISARKATKREGTFYESEMP